MIYVMSDIHGEYEKYCDMLKKLQLKDDDALFVLGDVIDFGKDGIKILKDMMYRANIYPVLGEHEYMAKTLLPKVQSAKTADECAKLVDDESKQMFAHWLKNGGYPTLEAFLALSEEDKESVLDYLGEFVPYDEVEAGGRDFVLVHAGIRNFEEDKELDDYEEADFVTEKADYGKVYFKNKFLVTGHTPTAEIIGGKDGKVFSSKRHLALDSAETADGKLAAVCLDTMKVYYV